MPYKYLPIEKKHTYNNMLKNLTYNGNTAVPALLFTPTYPSTQGTTSSQRIGDRIDPSSLVLDFVMQHTTGLDYPFWPDLYDQGNVVTSVSGTFTNGTGSITSSNNALQNYKPVVPWHATFRLMLIKHDDILALDTADDCVDWFEANFVPYRTDPSIWSVQCPLLRETTDDTGTFSIVYDHVFKLTSSKPNYHFSHTFPLKGHMAFNPTSPAKPTNVRYTFVIFGPMSYLDTDYSIKQFMGVNNVTASMSGVLKMNYIDI